VFSLVGRLRTTFTRSARQPLCELVLNCFTSSRAGLTYFHEPLLAKHFFPTNRCSSLSSFPLLLIFSFYGYGKRLLTADWMPSTLVRRPSSVNETYLHLALCLGVFYKASLFSLVLAPKRGQGHSRLLILAMGTLSLVKAYSSLRLLFFVCHPKKISDFS